MSSGTIALQRSWRCPSCSHSHKFPARPLSTTAYRQQIGPESPSYVDIPQPRQFPHYERRERVKGILPVPRNVFRRAQDISAIDERYLERATKEPQSKGEEAVDAAASKLSSHALWKRRMAEVRRKNYREGTAALRDRQLLRQEITAHRQAEAEAFKKQLAQAKEREDERLTKTTTTALMQPIRRGYILPDPDREVRVAEMKERVRVKEEGKAADRQQALHTLYMEARNFIVTEEQLDKSIDEAFGSTDQPKRWARGGPSIWYDRLPETVAKKLMNASRARNGLDAVDSRQTEQRLGRLAEELTGGKMDKP